jgi:hypothetical protein
MAWPKGKPRKAAQTEETTMPQIEAPVIEPVAVATPEPAPEPVDAPVLADWLAGLEELHFSRGVVLVTATHPDAVTGIHTGKYSGIRIAPGPLSAVWSDGSTL